MGVDPDTEDTPHDVKIERFARRTVSIGSFLGGMEKTVEYDDRVERPTEQRTQRAGGETVTVAESVEVQYRQFREVQREEPAPDESLRDLVREQTIFTVVNRDDISYREVQDVEILYLVSWDDGEMVKIKTEDEIEDLLSVASTSSKLFSEEEIEQRVEEELSEPDTDVPVPEGENEPEAIEA